MDTDNTNTIDNMINTIIQGDCIEVMKQIPDKSIDLVLTDPPYGIGCKNILANLTRGKITKTSNWLNYGDDCQWDNKIPDKIYFDEMIRVSKNQIIFGGNYFINYLHSTSCMLVWDKNNNSNDFADFELAWTSFKSACRIFKYTWNGLFQENMKCKEQRVHPTQKPVGLLLQILQKYSKDTDLILDPFAGSGSTLVAAKQFNRRYIGIELSEKYCNIARTRLKNVSPLFDYADKQKTEQISMFSEVR